jgi:hypothetical protein
MVYLLATLANDADYVPSLLHALGAELELPAAPAPLETWGVGYFAEGRALIIRKPAEILKTRSVFDLAPQVSSRVVVACAQSSPVREQTPPFRFRRWLFACTGELHALGQLRGKLLDRLPDFVRTELGAASPGELAFGMFLAELHRSQLLDDPLADVSTLGAALGRTGRAIHMLVNEASGDAELPPVRAAFVATNGKVVLVSRAGMPLFLKQQEGLEALPDGPPDPALTDFKQIAEALKRFRAVVIARNVAQQRPGWRELEEGRTVAIDNKLDILPIEVA